MWSTLLATATRSASPTDWFPMPIAFTPNAALLLVAEAGAIHGYRASDGEDLGAIEVDNGDGGMGFAVQAERRRVWLPRAQPRAYEFAATW